MKTNLREKFCSVVEEIHFLHATGPKIEKFYREKRFSAPLACKTFCVTHGSKPHTRRKKHIPCVTQITSD